MRTLFCVFVVLFAMPLAHVHAKTLSYKVKIGQKIQLGTRVLINTKTCKVFRVEKYTIIKKPKLGRLKFAVENRLLKGVGNAPTKRCAGKKYKTRVIYYVAGKSKGKDSFSLYSATDGKRGRVKFSVKIR